MDIPDSQRRTNNFNEVDPLENAMRQLLLPALGSGPLKTVDNPGIGFKLPEIIPGSRPYPWTLPSVEYPTAASTLQGLPVSPEAEAHDAARFQAMIEAANATVPQASRPRSRIHIDDEYQQLLRPFR